MTKQFLNFWNCRGVSTSFGRSSTSAGFHCQPAGAMGHFGGSMIFWRGEVNQMVNNIALEVIIPFGRGKIAGFLLPGLRIEKLEKEKKQPRSCFAKANIIVWKFNSKNETGKLQSYIPSPSLTNSDSLGNKFINYHHLHLRKAHLSKKQNRAKSLLIKGNIKSICHGFC